jgi:hypothetical protein
MGVRPPKLLWRPPPKPAVDLVGEEILAEKASTLGRLSHRLETALAALTAAPEDEDLLDRAGEALWYFVIQRELCGFRNTDAMLRELGVLPAVRLRMGVRR